MCLAVPGKLISRQGDEAIVSMHGTSVHVSTVLVPEVAEGDWVLVHAGFAIQRLDEAEAQETWALLAQMDQAHQAAMRGESGGGRDGEEAPK